ncbi:MAG: hypothetical protein AAFX81_18700, partial [Pseudomonadota bacterium]
MATAPLPQPHHDAPDALPGLVAFGVDAETEALLRQAADQVEFASANASISVSGRSVFDTSTINRFGPRG